MGLGRKVQWVQLCCRWESMIIPSAKKSNCSKSVHDFQVRHKSLNSMMSSCILIYFWVLFQPSANPRKSKFHHRKVLIRLHTVTSLVKLWDLHLGSGPVNFQNSFVHLVRIRLIASGCIMFVIYMFGALKMSSWSKRTSEKLRNDKRKQ